MGVGGKMELLYFRAPHFYKEEISGMIKVKNNPVICIYQPGKFEDE